ncbi:MAG TPA: adenylate kinase family protein [Candidatus Thermoplasmatota archaeon]|nr:adenylate kinase family protein [Candidatus Thermoplasmatota archaeon]
MVRVALTGTPGVGKTTVALLAARQGWRVVNVREWAEAEGAVAGHDPDDDAVAIDVRRLARRMPADDGADVLYEGHLSHLLPVDGAWVLRCDPRVLRPRLEVRGYRPRKVAENLEAEAIDLILQEALPLRRVVQRDGTRRTPAQVLKAFAEAGVESLKAPDLEPVDWSGQLPLGGGA